MLGLIDDHDIEPEWNPPGCGAELQKVHTAFASAHSHVHHSAEQSSTLHNIIKAQPFRYAVPLQAQRVYSQATWSHNSMTLHAMDALVATVLKTLVALEPTYRNNTSIKKSPNIIRVIRDLYGSKRASESVHLEASELRRVPCPSIAIEALFSFPSHPTL